MKNKGKICSVEGCGLPVYTAGRCSKCYQREVAYPKIKAKSQTRKEPSQSTVARPSADIDAMLKPLHANIAYLKTRRKEINNWLNTLTEVVEFLESAK